MKRYNEVCHEIFKDVSEAREFDFTYLYIPKPKKQEDFEKLRTRAIDCIRPEVEKLFKIPTTNHDVLTMLKNLMQESNCKVDITKDTFSKREITQLEKVLDKIRLEQDNPIQKVAMEWLLFIINTYKDDTNDKLRKTRMQRVQVDMPITQEDDNQENANNEYK